MNTQTTTHAATADTAEPVTAPVLPADDRAGDGYDWMDTLEGTAWSVLPNWGSEGWDAGSWPYIIFAVARTHDRNGELFGYGTYVEGDTSTHWFRSQDACFAAITAEVFFHWASGQSDALAIAYLTEALEGMGYEVEQQWFEPREGEGRSANVIATLLGTENPELVYVVSSHFDSVLGSPGADDNSSGTTALLEAARVLRDHPRRATIQFAFLTAEEAGLRGAREFVRLAQAEGKRIVGVLNNDMVGWAGTPRLDDTVRYSSDAIRDIQHAAAILFSDLITYDARYYLGTDAGVFYEAYGDIAGGIGSYPVLGNPNYHQATDRLDTVNQRLVAEVSRTTVATIMLLADRPARVGNLRTEFDGDTRVVRWDPSPEAGVGAYEIQVAVATGDGGDVVGFLGTRTVEEPEVRLEGGETGIAVRAVRDDGVPGWDWSWLTFP